MISGIFRVIQGWVRIRGDTDGTMIGNVGSSLNVDVTASALPSGAATATNQTTANASLSSIDSKLTSPVTVTGPLTDTQLRATAVPISAASLPLPTGASTSANQTTANASLSSIDTKLSSGAQKTQLVDASNVNLGTNTNPVYVQASSSKSTYSASISALAASAITGDLFSIFGSATKKVTVTKLEVSGLQTTAANTTINLIKRSTANTGGGLGSVVQTQSSYTTASSTTATVTVTSTGAGNLLVIGISNKDNRTVSSISDGTNSFVQACAGSNGVVRSEIWYLATSTAGKTTITVTLSGTSTTKGLVFWEVSGSGRTLDMQMHTNGVPSGGVDAGGPVIATSADFIAGMTATNGTITANPASFTSGGAIVGSGTGAGASLLAGPGSYSPSWSDSGGTLYANCLAAFVAIGNTQPTLTAVPHDSNNAAATSSVKYYYATPTTGTAIGQVRSVVLAVPTTASPQQPDKQLWKFGEAFQQGIVLNGTSESLNINLPTNLPGAIFSVDVEWVEET